MLKVILSKNGSVFIELLIAILIISVGLWGLMESFNSKAKLIRNEEIRFRALLIAQSLADYYRNIGWPINANELSPAPLEVGIGDCPGYRWRLENRPDSGCQALKIYYLDRLESEVLVEKRRDES